MEKYNSSRLYGEVTYFEAKEYATKNGSSAIKSTWSLKCKEGAQYAYYLPCETWDKKIASALIDGMTIELTDYLPKNNRFQDPQTQLWKNRFVIAVKQVKILTESAENNSVLIEGATKPINLNTQDPTYREFVNKVNNFNVEKEVEKILKEAPLEEEDVISLDDWDNPPSYEEEQKVDVTEVLNKSVKTTPLKENKEELAQVLKEIDELKKQGLEYAQPVVTNDFLDKLNNYPLENNDSQNGEDIVIDTDGKEI